MATAPPLFRMFGMRPSTVLALSFLMSVTIAAESIGADPKAGWSLTIPATEMKSHAFRDPAALERIIAIKNLSGRPDPRRNPDEKGRGRVQGWVKYEFRVPKSAWYEISLDDDAKTNQFFINETIQLTPGLGQKAGSVWLEAGKHTLRIEKHQWRGFGPIHEIVVREVTGENLEDTLRCEPETNHTVFRKGESLPLRIQAGARTTGSELTVQLQNKQGGEGMKEHQVPILPSVKPETIVEQIPLMEEGVFRVVFLERGKPISDEKIAPIDVVVVDTTPVPPSSKDVTRKLVEEIDVVGREPDFSNGETSRIVETTFGKYRESGDAGYLQNMNAEKPSWFSYKVQLPDLDGPYMVEVDYPDDAYRSTIVQVRQGVPEIGTVDHFPYSTGIGADAGGEFSLSHEMKTLSFFMWPTGRDWRVTLITPQNGSRAAASKIRIYKVTSALHPTPGYEPNGRPFVQWYEEGLSYLTAFGGSQNSVDDILRGTDQWLQTLSYMGANMVLPTVAIYQMAMYPSLFNRDFNQPTTFDIVRLILLLSEKYGVEVVAGFAPEAREVAWLSGKIPAEAPNILRSKSGAFPEEPRRGYSPVHPLNQEWYIAMLREFVERYRDLPAFRGVALRVMDWANPGLINFHSLDWGYDDFTIGLFEKETGIKVPGTPGDETRFATRADWLLKNNEDEWIQWRCDKVTDLYRRIVEMVREVDPELEVFTDVSPPADRLRGMGVDLKKLGELDGLTIIQGNHRYGRNKKQLPLQEMRDRLVDRNLLTKFKEAGAGANFFFTQAYVEATKVVTPNEQLGYPTNAPHGWMSGVVNPAGDHVNERWALALAEADAQLLGDGGNANTVGQPPTRRFIQEYRQLPAVPFTPRPEARDPVAVWEATIGDERWFYAVNRERFSIPVTITFASPEKVTRVLDGSSVDLVDNAMSLSLAPYEMRLWKTPISNTLETITVKVPDKAIEMVTAQVAWLADLNEKIAKGASSFKVTPEEQSAIQEQLARAKAALEQGHIRAARSFLENVTLLGLYQNLGQFPPNLRDADARTLHAEAP